MCSVKSSWSPRPSRPASSPSSNIWECAAATAWSRHSLGATRTHKVIRAGPKDQTRNPEILRCAMRTIVRLFEAPRNDSRQLARRGGLGIAGVGRAGRLDQKDMNFLPCHGPMLHTPGDDVDLPRPERDGLVAQLDVELSLQDEEEVIG